MENLFSVSRKTKFLKTIITQFANQEFSVLEDYTLPEPVQRLFFYRKSITAGLYTVQELEDYWMLEL